MGVKNAPASLKRILILWSKKLVSTVSSQENQSQSKVD
jgi:hypothetical protein